MVIYSVSTGNTDDEWCMEEMQIRETDVLSYLVRLHRALVHVQVPHLCGEVVSGQQVASTVAELDVRNGGNDL